MAVAERDAIRAAKGSTVSPPTAVQLAVFPWFACFHPVLTPALQHLPRLIWRRPGRSLPGTFAASGLSPRFRHLTIRSLLIRHSYTSGSH